MNYRLGFQRVYVVLALTWLASVVFLIFSAHWQPWYSPVFNAGWSSTATESTALEPLTIVKSEPLTAIGAQAKNERQEPPLTISPEDFLRQVAERERRFTMWRWATGLAIVPPMFGYACLFYLVPWIFRGFKPRPQT